MTRDASPHRRPRAASGPVFASFLERDATREKRRRSRRNTLVLSLLVHGLALGALALYSMWDVSELYGPSVEVKVYSRSAAPPAAVAMPPSRGRLPDPLR